MHRASALLLVAGLLVACRSGVPAGSSPSVPDLSRAECIVLVQAPRLASWGPVAGDTLQLLPTNGRSGRELGGLLTRPPHPGSSAWWTPGAGDSLYLHWTNVPSEGVPDTIRYVPTAGVDIAAQRRADTLRGEAEYSSDFVMIINGERMRDRGVVVGHRIACDAGGAPRDDS